jgi:hypothetical protein
MKAIESATTRRVRRLHYASSAGLRGSIQEWYFHRVFLETENQRNENSGWQSRTPPPADKTRRTEMIHCLKMYIGEESESVSRLEAATTSATTEDQRQPAAVDPRRGLDVEYNH